MIFKNSLFGVPGKLASILRRHNTISCGIFQKLGSDKTKRFRIWISALMGRRQRFDSRRNEILPFLGKCLI